MHKGSRSIIARDKGKNRDREAEREAHTGTAHACTHAFSSIASC
jgi:hypothetical protein